MNLADTPAVAPTEALDTTLDVGAIPSPAPTPFGRLRPDLPNALRLCGAALLALSLSRFLLAGVAVDNDLQRFGLLLFQSAVFTGTGFAVARWLDDLRGARLLFGIALLSVPAGITVLGAMVYSLVPLDAADAALGHTAAGAARDLPGFARWHIASARDIALASLATVLVLVPTTFFGFATLARRSAVRLGAALLACSALLLVPVRDPALAGVLVLAGLAGALWTWRSLRGTDDALNTLEGRFAQALLVVPAAIVAVRALVADDPGAVFVMLLALAGLLAARTALRATARTSRWHRLVLPLGGLCAFATVPGLYQLFDPALGRHDEIAAVAAMLVVGALLVELSRHSDARRTAAALETLWSLPLLAGAVLGNLLFADLVSALLCGTAVLALALYRNRPWLVVAAVAALAWPFAGALSGWVMDHRWEGLSVLGVAVIVGAGIVQRRGGAGRARDDADAQASLSA